MDGLRMETRAKEQRLLRVRLDFRRGPPRATHDGVRARDTAGTLHLSTPGEKKPLLGFFLAGCQFVQSVLVSHTSLPHRGGGEERRHFRALSRGSTKGSCGSSVLGVQRTGHMSPR